MNFQCAVLQIRSEVSKEQLLHQTFGNADRWYSLQTCIMAGHLSLRALQKMIFHT